MLRAQRFASVLVGLDTLAANPLRTALSTLGIVMGSASLVAVLSLGDGLERFALPRSSAPPTCTRSR